ncbi:fluoride efflux transporter FluC [Pseudarthrobacter cellobiosi]|uniref:fluoride efflux transporter FluC n=1 Tax=Pseudarthrobacter cellobiosi TaxID=2953654 RepID=UPI00208EA868|nr:MULTISPECIES: CrcB family protein [unclassified Pseudarthrobacter]MCO4257335.1 CrcB family protein [Pseudarthrobacter sp. HLT1-5]MCO4273741.1 CrcB family protein [Pseudarthrobacter sp. HLT3-5]
MMGAVLVGVFGMAGALLRFAVDSWFAHRGAQREAVTASGTPRHWPWATLTVNVTGCLIIGLSIGITGRLGLAPEWQAAVATGLAGGLTTFSSWTTATVRLLSESRFGAAVLNIGANLAAGFAAAALGIALAS